MTSSSNLLGRPVWYELMTTDTAAAEYKDVVGWTAAPFDASPGRNLRWQISAEGGAQPRWRADGRELFSVSLEGTLAAVPITLSSDEVSAGMPVPLFTERTLRNNNNLFYYGGAAAYDVRSDGQRFLINRLTQEPTAGPIHLVLSWRRP